MAGFRSTCLILLATALADGVAWRPADHPAPILHPVAGLTRPLHVAAEAEAAIAWPCPRACRCCLPRLSRDKFGRT